MNEIGNNELHDILTAKQLNKTKILKTQNRYDFETNERIIS